MNRVTRLAALSLLTFVTFASTAPAEVSRQLPGAQLPQPSASISLSCTGAGHSDVESRNHVIKNTTGHTIPKGTILHWTASDKGTGELTLTADLAAGASVDVIKPGQTNGYSCTASFLPGPADFAVKSVVWTNDQTATVVIENLSPWTDGAPAMAKVQAFKCVSVPGAAVGIPFPAIPKGGSVSLATFLPQKGEDYLQATANVNDAVPESNFANNTRKSNEFSTNKSCTPQ